MGLFRQVPEHPLPVFDLASGQLHAPEWRLR
jgi:hypothetical protein